MKDSIVHDKQLPENLTDYEELKRNDALQYDCCCSCGFIFTTMNVHTREGWLETQISGMCEECWDDMCEEMEPNPEDLRADYHDDFLD